MTCRAFVESHGSGVAHLGYLSLGNFRPATAMTRIHRTVPTPMTTFAIVCAQGALNATICARLQT
jgi:hypothetical protein